MELRYSAKLNSRTRLLSGWGKDGGNWAERQGQLGAAEPNSNSEMIRRNDQCLSTNDQGMPKVKMPNNPGRVPTDPEMRRVIAVRCFACGILSCYLQAQRNAGFHLRYHSNAADILRDFRGIMEWQWNAH